MVRVTNAGPSRRRRYRVLKQVKGAYGDRKNHLRSGRDTLIKAMAYNTEHRRLKKRQFKCLWSTRIGIAARIHGLSYSRMIHGLLLTGNQLDRKTLADIAFRDPAAFAVIADSVKKTLEKSDAWKLQIQESAKKSGLNYADFLAGHKKVSLAEGVPHLTVEELYNLSKKDAKAFAEHVKLAKQAL